MSEVRILDVVGTDDRLQAPTAPVFSPTSDGPFVSQKVVRYLTQQRPATPCLVVDLDVVAERYRALSRALPGALIHYAVKANPAPEILARLKAEGSSFDVASPGEIDICLEAGISVERLSYGNTIKKRADIAYAYDKGVRLFAFDCENELEKLAENAPGSDVFCRLLVNNTGADWPLSRKFGCGPDMAVALMVRARELGLNPVGLSFHVGSQQRNRLAWAAALKEVAFVLRSLKERGIAVSLVNLGGGLPARYNERVADIADYGTAITEALNELAHEAGAPVPRLIVEPGRYMVADAGVIESEIVMIARKDFGEETRWVYLDIGRFSGLAETEGEAIKYPVRTDYGAGKDEMVQNGPVILAGPTCDSADILYEKSGYRLPSNLKDGDRVQFLSAGAYTTTYASVGFNGFAPLRAIYI